MEYILSYSLIINICFGLGQYLYRNVLMKFFCLAHEPRKVLGKLVSRCVMSPYLTVSTNRLAIRFLLFSLKTQILLIPQTAGSGTSEHCQALEHSLPALGSDRTRKACNDTQ